MNQNKSDQKIFGENIRLLRKVHRLSQKQMASIANISVYCLQKAEQGVFTNSLGSDAIINLSRHFHLHPSMLFAPSEKWTISLLLQGNEDV